MRFQILYRLPCRSFSNSSIEQPSTPGAPLLVLTFSHALHTSHFEISNGFPDDFSSPTRLLPSSAPRLIERTQPRMTRPFAPPPLQELRHYYGPVRRRVLHRYSIPRGFSRLGTLPLSTHPEVEPSAPAFPRST